MKTNDKKNNIDTNIHEEIETFKQDGLGMIKQAENLSRIGSLKVDVSIQLLTLPYPIVDNPQIINMVISENSYNKQFRKNGLYPVDNTTAAGTIVRILDVEIEKASPSDKKNHFSQQSLNGFIEFYNSIDYPDRLFPLLEDFKLTERHGIINSAKSPLITAWEIYNTKQDNNSNANASLTTMRSCLNIVINSLIDQCHPKFKPAKKMKISFLCTKIGKNSLTDTRIKYLIEEYPKLWDKLSGSKDECVSREEWRKRLLDACYFLEDLFTALDPQKF